MAKKTVKQNADGTITVWGSRGYEGKIATAGKTLIPTENTAPPIAAPAEDDSSVWGRMQRSLDTMEQYAKTGPVARWLTGDGDTAVKQIRMKLLRRMVIPSVLAAKIAASLPHVGEHPINTALSSAGVAAFVGLSISATRHKEKTIARGKELTETITSSSENMGAMLREDNKVLAVDSPTWVAKQLVKAGRIKFRSQWREDSNDVTKKYFEDPLKKYLETIERDGVYERIVVTDYAVKDNVVSMQVKRESHARSQRATGTVQYDPYTGILSSYESDDFDYDISTGTLTIV